MHTVGGIRGIASEECMTEKLLAKLPVEQTML